MSRAGVGTVLSAGAATLALAACGGSTPRATTVVVKRAPATAASTTSTVTAPKPAPKPPAPPYPQLLGGAVGSRPTGFVPAVRWQGRTAAWIARSLSGVSLMSFDQRLLELHLHSGTVDAGTLGWRYGPSVGGAELGHLAAAFNGGFKLSVGVGGFESYGRIGAPLHDGLGSVVTYTDGTTDIGSWHQGVPAPGRRVASVRQNQPLLIDHGTAASSVGCDSCWGATLGGVAAPARSALGVTADGRLIWAGGEQLTVSQLAGALLGAHVVRAVELDINPEWVAGYLYGHRGGKGPLAPVPALAAQHGIPGEFLAPWSRDFFTIVAR
ncbi:MAG TPA: hypothetical protein VMP89_19375 [Solirubrobacteraceae bacterium]|nr:hypothetical protein [Solirubrobacteraceae bacterium]